MSHARPNILLVTTFYPEYLDARYTEDPSLADLGFAEQSQRLLADGFGVIDAYAAGLRNLGCPVTAIVVNADRLQGRWAAEQGLVVEGDARTRRRRIVAAQVAHYQPEVMLVFEWSPLGDAFLHTIKPGVGLLAAQLASHLPDNRTFAAYDLALSSWPPLVDYFRANGLAAEPFRLGFDERLLDGPNTSSPQFDVTFIGGLGPAHDNRIRWLEALMGEIDVDVFGYGLERTDETSRIRGRHRGAVWGRRMFDVLGRSRITLNLHGAIRIRERETSDLANNMRLFEATGMGTCLLTDAKVNLGDLFEPEREVATFADASECAAKVRHLLAHEEERRAIARAGQRRTLSEHTYSARMVELLDLFERHLARGTGKTRVHKG